MTLSIHELTDVQILERYKPKVHIHPNEKYYPISIEQYINCSDIYYTTSKIQDKGTYTLSDLKQICQPYIGDCTKLSFYPDMNQVPNNIKNINTVPFYSAISRSQTLFVLQYHFLYAYNGSYNILGLFETGAHFGDLEHITIEINPITGQIIRIYFGRHRQSEGRWISPNDCLIEDNHVNIYSALNGHGMYNKPGTAWRYVGFANDITSDKGITWFCDNVCVVSYNTEWIFLPINLGYPDSGSMIANTGFFLNEYQDDEPKTVGCFTCLQYSKKTSLFCG
jgi:hypothetical protein